MMRRNPCFFIQKLRLNSSRNIYSATSESCIYLKPSRKLIFFDVFCGTGVYDNGKKGSPIVAFESIAEIRTEYGFQKCINLIVNDSEAEKIEAVRGYIEDRNENHCTVGYYTLPANEMFARIRQVVHAQANNVRNLIFVDPYGYKEIKNRTLRNLLENQRTEIILFLPISQM